MLEDSCFFDFLLLLLVLLTVALADWLVLCERSTFLTDSVADRELMSGTLGRLLMVWLSFVFDLGVALTTSRSLSESDDESNGFVLLLDDDDVCRDEDDGTLFDCW